MCGQTIEQTRGDMMQKRQPIYPSAVIHSYNINTIGIGVCLQAYLISF